MRLFKRFRVIKTVRSAPAWIGKYSWMISGLAFFYLLIVILFQGYRLSPFGFESVILRFVEVLVGLGIITEACFTQVLYPLPEATKRRRWVAIGLALLVFFAVIVRHFVLPLVLIYQIIAIGHRLSRTNFFVSLFSNLHQRAVRPLVFGFATLIATGTLLLTLPQATADGRGANFITALFTATSAISTTGLTVVDIGSYYTLFGQLVVLLLIQIGGVGYMAFIAFVMLGISGRLTVNLGILFRESITQLSTLDVKRFVRAVVAITLIVEGSSACFLFLEFSRHFPLMRALYWGIFHSVSAFCTAGFALAADNFMAYKNNLFMNIIINLLCLAGSLGFFVIFDLYQWRRRLGVSSPHRLSIHTKFALALTGALIFTGTLIVLFAEWHPPSLSIAERLLTASFQTISAGTTTGFNTVDIGRMIPTSLLFLAVLMFIGASPGSTGGGIKTTTFGVLLFSLVARLQNRKSATIFRRQLSSQTVSTAATITTAFVLWATIVLLIFTLTERANFLSLFFEVISALGTVGLSTGITSQLTVLSKLLLILTMFFGRVGPFALAFALVGTKKTPLVVYPEADIIVG